MHIVIADMPIPTLSSVTVLKPAKQQAEALTGSAHPVIDIDLAPLTMDLAPDEIELITRESARDLDATLSRVLKKYDGKELPEEDAREVIGVCTPAWKELAAANWTIVEPPSANSVGDGWWWGA